MRPPGPRRAARLRTALVAVALTGVGVLTTVPASAAPSSAPARTCHLRDGVHHADTLGNSFSKDLYCENKPGDLYGRAYFTAPVTGRLKSSTSWFVCWTLGDPHPGGNNVWYYTQGDEALQFPTLKAWGSIPADHLWTEQDPVPGLPRCPWR
ncbi:hypothetical protein A6A06_15065 [Streptomyces sp. CB02923]|uniref:hypothetical protein n=1 Tax=Streptomyces sp. CB02923 TaxID=1718985 RepID=UPI0009404A5D|nr:hypothetical protein [Streptomyces sp. CB02923]OKI02364.1 hypothetical protein A6A06_15065 [Streptomyces sp. CB02923]